MIRAFEGLGNVACLIQSLEDQTREHADGKARRLVQHPRAFARSPVRPDAQIRPALSTDVPALDRIALEAKAHWGYPDRLLALWRDELLTPPETLRSRPTFVAELEGRPIGFAQLDPDGEHCELAALWVLPDCMGRGIGRALLRQVCRTAAAAGYGVIEIDADPNAAPFYAACGATQVDQVPAPIDGEPARVRPRFLLETGLV